MQGGGRCQNRRARTARQNMQHGGNGLRRRRVRARVAPLSSELVSVENLVLREGYGIVAPTKTDSSCLLSPVSTARAPSWRSSVHAFALKRA